MMICSVWRYHMLGRSQMVFYKMMDEWLLFPSNRASNAELSRFQSPLS